MALIDCPECGKSVSDSAESCPQCGYAVRRHLIREAVALHGESGGKEAESKTYAATPAPVSFDDVQPFAEVGPWNKFRWTHYTNIALFVLIPCEILIFFNTVLDGDLATLTAESFVTTLPGRIGAFIGSNILVILTLFVRDKDSRLPLAAVMASITVIIIAILYFARG